jgi:chromosome segregation ATPase
MKPEELATLKETANTAEASVETLRGEVAAIESAEEVDKAALKEKKAELRSAESALKKANKAVEKGEVAAEKQAAKDAKAAEKTAAAEAKAKAAQEKEDAKAAKLAEREANRMPEQNGIRRPRPATKCGRVWELADSLSTEAQPVSIAELLATANAEGLNEGNTKAEYARWRKFNGITGRIVAEKAEANTEGA